MTPLRMVYRKYLLQPLICGISPIPPLVRMCICYGLCRAANSRMIQNTFVAKEGKDKQKARLSWYHPDDTVSVSTQ